jgi:hypothetical protein
MRIAIYIYIYVYDDDLIMMTMCDRLLVARQPEYTKHFIQITYRAVKG